VPAEYVRDNAYVPHALGSVREGITERVNATVYSVFTGSQFTTNAQRAMHRLGLSKRAFNRAIHNIKKQVEGNPNMVFDIITGDVYDQRAGEWIGNLLDDKD
jgi:pimeloyl-CoA synthetase